MILKLLLLLVLSVFTWHTDYCTADNAIRSPSTAGKYLGTASDFRKALLEALERLENEHTPDPLFQDSSIRTKKEEQNTVVAGRKVRDKKLREEAVVVDTLFTSNVTRGNNHRSTITKRPENNVLSVNEQIPVAESQTLLVAPRPTAATPVHQLATVAAAAPAPAAPAPTELESSDEDETKAKVEDVQFIHAPLVAAFTVQQDDKGLPQKVIPIYGNKHQHQQQKLQQTQINTVRKYQTDLEEKQRALEQQIRVLQEQRRQQELLLWQQQQQQLTLHNSAARNIVASAVTQANPLQGDTVVSLQPSVSFQPSAVLLQNRQHLIGGQELPVKSAAVFRSGVLQSLPRHYRDNVFNPDHYLKEFYYRQRTLVPPPPRSNRVFRQEATHVGNLGLNQDHDEHHRHTQQHSYQFNDNYNSIIATSPDTTAAFIPNQYLQQHNIFSSSNSNNNNNFNNRLPKFNVNDRLKNLILQSGLGQGRTQEDLNIVSKVLALDHSATRYPNFLFSESSSVSEKRLPFATFNTT